jgi:ABC-type glycerol-3-phosphate transport system substrate-binding protein
MSGTLKNVFTFDRLKLVAAGLFFLALIVLGGSAQKGVLEQKDPQVLNFLASGYCPGLVRPDSPPLTMMDVVVKGPGLGDHGYWEQLAAERHRQGVPGYHQPWKVRFLQTPALGSSRGSWALTRLMGGMAPEFMWSMATPEFHDKGHHWYINLTPYLHEPNPYVPGNKRWIDIFYPDAIARWRSSADQNFYAVPIDQVEIAIFYNKDIMAECGISEQELPPRDWAHFLDIQRRIQEAGHIPFLMTAANNMRIGWMWAILSDMIYAEVYDELNMVDDPTVNTSKISSQELVRGVKRGIIDLGGDRYWETWRIMKDWSRYWQKGALGNDDLLAFRRGQAAMCVDGSWMVKLLTNDEKRDFEYGVFFIPKITRKTSPFAIGAEPRGVGGSTAIQYSITKETASRKGAVEACVDLLRWLTAPQHLGPMVAEGQSFLPAVEVAEEDFAENLRFMKPVLARGAARYRGPAELTSRCRDEWWSAMQYYLEGSYDRQDVVEHMSEAVDRAMDEALDKYKDKWRWAETEDPKATWEILPGDNEVLVDRLDADGEVRP